LSKEASISFPSSIAAWTSALNTAQRTDVPKVDAACISSVPFLSSNTCLQILLLNFSLQLGWAKILKKGLRKSFTPEIFTLPASAPASGLQSIVEFLSLVRTSAALSLRTFGVDSEPSSSVSVQLWWTVRLETSVPWWGLLEVWDGDFHLVRSCLLEREAKIEAPSTAEGSPLLLSSDKNFPIPLWASAPLTATSVFSCWKI